MGRGWRHPQGFQDGWDKKDGEDLANLEQKLGAGMSREPGEPGAGCGFCLAPNSHPLPVSFPGHTQPSQPDGSDPPGPPPKAPGHPRWPCCPLPVAFLSKTAAELGSSSSLCWSPPRGRVCTCRCCVPIPSCSCLPRGQRGAPGPISHPCVAVVRCPTWHHLPVYSSLPKPESPLETSGQMVAGHHLYTFRDGSLALP